MIVIKLGGSVITDKKIEKCLRGEVLADLARAISAINEPVAIVHGAGSFGHIRAKRSGVGRGPHTEDRSDEVSGISADVRELDQHVLNVLLEAGMNPVSVPPSAVCVTRDGSISSFSSDAVIRWTGMGFTPVMFGDVVSDETMGVSIVSGDRVMFELARVVGARMAIFISDVDGVFDRPPADPAARLLSTVNAGDRISFEGTVDDVTGALEGKLVWMFRMANMDIETWIVSGLAPERVTELAVGGHTIGTRILPTGDDTGGRGG